MNQRKVQRSEGDELTVRSARANAGAAAAYKALLPILEKVLIELATEDTKPYALKHRIKPTASIKEKVERKRSESKKKHDESWCYEPEHVTDAVGFRVVTKFLQHIPLAVSAIIDLICHSSATPSPMKKGGLKELVIYTSRPNGDPLSINDSVVEIVKRSGFQAALKPPETKKSGYSSVHIVALVPVNFMGPDGAHVEMDFAVEIQVRDIFEEAWCETEHALRYVPQRGGALDPNDPQLRTWMPYLNALKTSLDGASQQASVIFNNAIASRKMADSKPRSDSRPADTAASGRSALLEALPADMHDLITNAYMAREAAEKTDDELLKRDHFTKASIAFDELHRQAADRDLLARKAGRWDVDYAIAMEDAYCRTLASDDDIERISAIYERMAERYPQDTIVLYRYGRLIRSIDIERSIDFFRRALEALPQDGAISPEHWLHAAVPRNLAYVIWKTSRALISGPEKESLIKEAAQYAYLAKEKSSQIKDPTGAEEVKATNSWVYYLLEISRINADGKENLANALVSLETLIKEKGNSDLETNETLAASWHWLGNHEKASLYASELASKLYQIARSRMNSLPDASPNLPSMILVQMREHLKGGELDAYDTALTILFGSAVRMA